MTEDNESFSVIENNVTTKDILNNIDKSFGVITNLSNFLVELTRTQNDTINELTRNQDKTIHELLCMVKMSISSSSPPTSFTSSSPPPSILSSLSSLPPSSSPPSSSPSSSSLSPPPPSSSPPPVQLYSAKDIKICLTTNWILPVEFYRDPCHICLYYGHGFRNCPNIIFTAQELQNICIKCWGPIHGTSTNLEYYKDPCHIRLYYEHGFINCPSIIFTVQELQNICIKCWGPIHETSGNCTNDRVTPLFKEGYIQPTQLIQNFFFRS
ncbi:unnamed protein product [Rhizophagus irregularis]|nr:unnamed protein product [Rhizophagus irregularis]